MDGNAELLPHLLQRMGPPADGVGALGEQLGVARAIGLLPVKIACREGQGFSVPPRAARLPGAQALPPAEGLVPRVLRYRPIHLGIRAIAHALKRRGSPVLQSIRARLSVLHHICHIPHYCGVAHGSKM